MEERQVEELQEQVETLKYQNCDDVTANDVIAERFDQDGEVYCTFTR